MKIYPDWTDDTPRTDASARISRFRQVANVRVVRVENASYRNAVLSGIFELEDQNTVNPIKTQAKGKKVVKVVCAWHGVTPRTTFPRLIVTDASRDIDASCDIIEKYTGQVADNIS